MIDTVDPYENADRDIQGIVFQEVVETDGVEVTIIALPEGLVIASSAGESNLVQVTSMRDAVKATFEKLQLRFSEVEVYQEGSVPQPDKSVNIRCRIKGLLPVVTNHRLRGTEDGRLIHVATYDLRHVGVENNFKVAVATCKLAEMILDQIAKQLMG